MGGHKPLSSVRTSRVAPARPARALDYCAGFLRLEYLFRCTRQSHIESNGGLSSNSRIRDHNQLRVRGALHSRDTLAARNNLAYWIGEAGDPAAARDQYVDLPRSQFPASRENLMPNSCNGLSKLKSKRLNVRMLRVCHGNKPMPVSVRTLPSLRSAPVESLSRVTVKGLREAT